MPLYARIKQYFSPKSTSVLESRVVVHLMRHGEAYHNIGHTRGQVNLQSYDIHDPFLTDDGIEQARYTRELMTERCPVPNIVLISPLARTIETAIQVFPVTNPGSIVLQPQIVAYDDLRECGPYLCNVRQGVTELSNEYNHKGVDFTALSPVIPPMESVIPTKQRAEIVRKEILGIVKIIREGGGLWKGVYLQGPALQSMGWPLRTYTCEDIHVVVVTHGSFIKYLLPSSHRHKLASKTFNLAEMRTYLMDAKGHLIETGESKGTRTTAIRRKVSSIFTSASG